MAKKKNKVEADEQQNEPAIEPEAQEDPAPVEAMIAVSPEAVDEVISAASEPLAAPAETQSPDVAMQIATHGHAY